MQLFSRCEDNTGDRQLAALAPKPPLRVILAVNDPPHCSPFVVFDTTAPSLARIKQHQLASLLAMAETALSGLLSARCTLVFFESSAAASTTADQSRYLVEVPEIFLVTGASASTRQGRVKISGWPVTNAIVSAVFQQKVVRNDVI